MSDNGSYYEDIADSFFFCFDLFLFQDSQIRPASKTDTALDIQQILCVARATIASYFYHVNISTICSVVDFPPVNNPIVEPPEP